MMRACVAALTGLLLASPAFAQSNGATFYGGGPNSPISGGVVIPAGKGLVWTSGTGPAVVNRDAPAGSPERYGDTQAQAKSVLQRLADQLKAQGLSMKDVVYIRAYLVADPNKNNQLDTQGWNAAFREVFGTADNPTKPARTTVGVAALVGAGQMVEVEAFAVAP